MSQRRKIAAGNWKMNRTPSEAAVFAGTLSAALKDAPSEVILGVPFICIPAVAAAVEGTKIRVAAQNMHWEEKGAYTGEISGAMLTDAGVTHVILGHSERRQYFGETDATVNLKVRAAIRNGLIPIVCVGESLAERELDVTAERVRYQVKAGLVGLTAEEAARLILAYEPIWAIGTGKTATNEQAREVCSLVRRVLAEMHGESVAAAIPVLYGGSVTRDNAAGLFACADIDGGLVGGASLKAEDFAVIANA